MENYRALDDPGLIRELVQTRIRTLGLFLFLLLSMLIYRYYSLQIEQFARYSTLSDDNRIHVRPVAPIRGLIFDRNGAVLAENRPSYTLSIVYERVENLDILMGELEVILDFSEAELSKFKTLSEAPRRPYQSVPLKYRLDEEEVALLAVNQHLMPGIEVEVDLLRHYPQGELFAHTLGYVGSINQREKAQLDAERYENTRVIGKIGIEKQYEDRLLGMVGFEHVETDARGNVLRVLERQDAVPGEDLRLHLDIGMQRLLHEQLQGWKGSGVAIDLATGGILAMASAPSYDPNLFVTGISYDDYNSLLHDSDRPLYDRSILGQYPPGSTVKPIFALAGLEEGAITSDWTIRDTGEFQLKGQDHKFRDWKKGGHGTVDLRVAIEQSCDIYFYELGHRVEIDVLSDIGSRFGLGQKTGIDMPSEARGIMPSKNWKRGARGQVWFPGDTINTSIGQGFMLTTPLQLVQMTAILATRGDNIKPRLLMQLGNRQSFEEENQLPVSTGLPIDTENTNSIQKLVIAAAEHWQLVHFAMEDVVHSLKGTANRLGVDIKYRMAGKTGTAQVVSIAQDEEYDAKALATHQRDHALFVGFAPAKKPRIAVAVVIENGEHGSFTAAPIAKVLMDYWLNDTNNSKLGIVHSSYEQQRGGDERTI